MSHNRNAATDTKKAQGSGHGGQKHDGQKPSMRHISERMRQTLQASPPEQHAVARNRQRDLLFEGWLAASADSREVFSQEQYRWQELCLYVTCAGALVCQRLQRSQWEDKRDVSEAAVCESLDQVLQFFGFDLVAKELYAQAGLDASEHVA